MSPKWRPNRCLNGIMNLLYRYSFLVVCFVRLGPVSVSLALDLSSGLVLMEPRLGGATDVAAVADVAIVDVEI